MFALEVKDLTKIFRKGYWPVARRTEFVAVNNISFSIKPGEILGFLGPNGAGKTTTIHMLLGVLSPTAGTINYWGTSFAHHRIELLKRISFASGYDKLPARLTVSDNLDIVGRLYSIPTAERKERIKELLKFFDLWDLRDRETGPLSAGQSTRVMLAKAFLPRPELVLLDEPTAALDPDVAEFVRKFVLAQKNESGVSFFFTSHNMDEVTQICDRVLVLKKGTIIADDKPEKLARSIANARIRLILEEDKHALLAYLQERKKPYTITGHEIEVDVDEDQIASFLIDLSDRKIRYSHISIDKPSLEDYFLTIAKQR
jgi:ABC-2 type transport system ATP-binding protein